MLLNIIIKFTFQNIRPPGKGLSGLKLFLAVPGFTAATPGRRDARPGSHLGTHFREKRLGKHLGTRTFMGALKHLCLI
jgi:hypothetical protein